MSLSLRSRGLGLAGWLARARGGREDRRGEQCLRVCVEVMVTDRWKCEEKDQGEKTLFIPSNRLFYLYIYFGSWFMCPYRCLGGESSAAFCFKG